MTAQPLPHSGTLRAVTAAEVRAELARQQKSSAQLARALGISPQAMSRRTTGELAFDLDELETVAVYLDVSIAQLLGLRGGPTVAKDAPGGPTVAKDAPPVLRLVPSPRSRSVTRTSPTPPLMQIVASR